MKGVTNMTAGGVIILVGFVVIACIFAVHYTTIGRRIWLRIKGTADEKLSQDASTPEGAAAYYNTAIEAKQTTYKEATQTLGQMTGKCATYEQQLYDYKKQKMQCEVDAKRCADNGDDDGARRCLRMQSDLEDKIAVLKDSVTELRGHIKVQEENVTTLKDDLLNLKSEKEKAILTLETSQTVQALQVDALASDSEEDKMLEKVRDGVQKAKEAAVGHKVAYENSDAVQQKRMDQKLKDADIEAKLQTLKSKK